MPPMNFSAFTKRPFPQPPGHLEGVMAVVGGTASVPIELHIEGTETPGAVGMDLVFLVDQSGSMSDSDPDKQRFKAIKHLSAEFTPTRDSRDRIAIVLFNGDHATVIDHDGMSWFKWSEVPAVVDDLVHMDPDGLTPMDAGMLKAISVLTAQNGLYKLAILLSDGRPEPDDDAHPQTANIVNVRVPAACEQRVIYSTVYLQVPGASPLLPEQRDNGLLMYIARETDYVTNYLPGDPPEYYFRIEQTDEMVQAYRELFDKLRNRRVPQDVRLVEKINPRLFIDPDQAPQFVGSGFDPEQNVMGAGLAPALENFAGCGSFAVRLNELRGEATLSFAVKLRIDTVTPSEFEQGFVELPVNDPSSYLSWLEPAEGAGSQTASSDLPQTRIRFELGLHVIKRVHADGNQISIAIDNLDQSAVPWFELAEHPSGFVNPSAFEDDLEFKPLAMLYEKRILPWFVALIPPAVLPTLPAQRTRMLNLIRQALRAAHAPFLSLADQLDELLGQFSTVDAPFWVDLDTFWRTPEVRGVYYLVPSLPGKASRYLRFRVQDASFVKGGTTARFFQAPADAVVEKESEQGLRPLSQYMAQGWPAPRNVLPNELRGQLAPPVSRPDLYVRTGLQGSQWRDFAALFRGLTLPVQPWQMLDSADIQPFWHNHGAEVGVEVRVHNGGRANVAPGVGLHVTTYFLPFIGVSASPPYSSSPPLVGSVTASLPAVPFDTDHDLSVVKSVSFTSLGRLPAAGGVPTSVDATFLSQVRKVLALTVVEIAPAPGEVLLANNRAIEIVPLSC